MGELRIQFDDWSVVFELRCRPGAARQKLWSAEVTGTSADSPVDNGVFGCGSTPSKAIDDLGQKLASLYECGK